MRFSIFASTALLLAAGAALASDDLTIVSKHTRDGKPGGNTTSYIASDHVRMARDEGNESIIDLKTGVMTILDGKKKTYYTVTKQDIEQMAAKMKERMDTPEMKQAMEAMASMGGGMSTQVDVKKMGTSRRIAGYSCEDWTITMGTMSTIKECVTGELQYPAQAWQTYRELSESMKNMTAAFGPMAKSAAEMVEKMKAMKGFPIATATAVNVMGRSSASETEVVEVRKGSIPASAWEIPAGYTKVENPMLKAFDGGGRSRR